MQGKCRFESNPATGAYNMVFGWEQLETTFFSWKSVKELTPKQKVGHGLLECAHGICTAYNVLMDLCSEMSDCKI